MLIQIIALYNHSKQKTQETIRVWVTTAEDNMIRLYRLAFGATVVTGWPTQDRWWRWGKNVGKVFPFSCTPLLKVTEIQLSSWGLSALLKRIYNMTFHSEVHCLIPWATTCSNCPVSKSLLHTDSCFTLARLKADVVICCFSSSTSRLMWMWSWTRMYLKISA